MRVALRVSWVNAARVPAEPGVGKGGVACVTGGDPDKTRAAVADGQRRRLVGGDHIGCRRGVLLATGSGTGHGVTLAPPRGFLWVENNPQRSSLKICI